MVGKSRETTSYATATLVGFVLLVVGIVAYLYFLNMSVVQVVMRTEAVQTQRDTTAKIAMLEARYMESQHAIANRIATLEGYDRDVQKIFVSREDAKLVLNSN